MAEHDPPESSLPQPAAPGARCPWCSASIASPDDATCGTCGATLHGDAAIEIPGVTAIDVQQVLRASAPRRVRGGLGSLFVGGDDDIPPPSEADLPALAMPDAEVRREMLRLRLDAELADLTARAAALAAERGIPMSPLPDVEPEPDAMPGPDAASDAATSQDGTTPPERDARP